MPDIDESLLAEDAQGFADHRARDAELHAHLRFGRERRARRKATADDPLHERLDDLSVKPPRSDGDIHSGAGVVRSPDDS
jgi:hypothetical protein